MGQGSTVDEGVAGSDVGNDVGVVRAEDRAVGSSSGRVRRGSSVEVEEIVGVYIVGNVGGTVVGVRVEGIVGMEEGVGEAIGLIGVGEMVGR